MKIKKYTIAEFRKSVREALNNVDEGGRTFISRHGKRYELVIADVQPGKEQLRAHNESKNLEQQLTEQGIATQGVDNGESNEDNLAGVLSSFMVVLANTTGMSKDEKTKLLRTFAIDSATLFNRAEKNIASADALKGGEL